MAEVEIHPSYDPEADTFGRRVGVVVRGGLGFSDTGISGFLPGQDRREVHAKAKA